ncbi:MAG: lysophospholipase [Spirochaetia bacterium]|nr:lysophospholipase [Spirochaetia bacterium]
MAETTIHIKAQDGLKLTGTIWEPKRPKQLLLWIHGFAEHRRRYAHFAKWMNEERVAFAAIDVRGHGDSEGRRGHVSDFSEYSLDCSTFLHWARQNFSKLPTTLGSHSHGGLIAARFLEENPSPIKLKCAVFSAPFLGLPPDFPNWKRNMGNFVARIAPTLSIPTGIDSNLLTHDQKIAQLYANDPTVFKTATSGWFSEVTLAHSRALSRAPLIKLPAIVLQGMADRIVNIDASRRFYEDIGSEKKFWVPYPGLYHEILNETSRLKVYEEIFKFIKKYGR